MKQVDKIEAFLQAIEYFGTGLGTPVIGWWEELEELVEHPILIEFLKAIEQRLYRKRKTRFDAFLTFLIRLSRLKRSPRSGWVLRRVQNPDSYANHAFMLALMAWLFAKTGRVRLRFGKLLKMALTHLIFGIVRRERTPYDTLLRKVKSSRERREILESWIRYPIAIRRAMRERRVREERQAVGKITAPLAPKLRNEIRGLFAEFQENQTRKAKFLNQTYITELLMQALRYRSADQRFPIAPWWEWAYEWMDSPLHLNFMATLKRRFH